MAEVKAIQCDGCKKILQPKTGIHVIGHILVCGEDGGGLIGGKNYDKGNKANLLPEIDLCPICFYNRMTIEFKNGLQNTLNNE